MNAILLTVLTLSGPNGTNFKAIDMVSPAVASDAGYADCCHGGRHGHSHAMHGHCWGPMPQTCYDPPYGCYPGSRFTNRYPAFHGTYYRRPYNYRNAFDYPWHADLHEPTSHFSYNVTGDTGGSRAPQPLPVAPVPTSAGPLPLHSQIERATATAPGSSVLRGVQSLRR